MKALKSLSDGVNKLCMYCAYIFLTILIVSSFVQVFTRYILNNSLSWTEEMARFSFIYFTMFGAACATKSSAHAVMDFVPKMFKGKVKAVHEVIVIIIMLICAILLVWNGFIVARITWNQFSPVMRFPIGVTYLSVPLASIAMVIHLIYDLAVKLSGKKAELEGKEVVL